MSMHDERPTSARRGLPDGVGWGIGLALGAALISGLAIFLNAFAVRQLPDAAVYTTLKNGVAAILLVGAALRLGAGRDLRALDRRAWGWLTVVGVIGGGVPFIMFFTGLDQVSATSAAFIQKTLFVWVALLAVPLLGERLGVAPILALGVLLAGQVLVLPPSVARWGIGETLILAATLLWAVETIVVKRLLGSIPAHVVAAGRMTFGLVVLVAYLMLTGKLVMIGTLAPVQWALAILMGGVLAAYVGTWFAALRRAPASVVTSVLVVGAVVTGALNAINKGTAPDPAAVGGYLLIVGAAGLIAGWAIRSARVARARSPLRSGAAAPSQLA
jgi:drug/metabolite transporter (DMT)-like permease